MSFLRTTSLRRRRASGEGACVGREENVFTFQDQDYVSRFRPPAHTTYNFQVDDSLSYEYHAVLVSVPSDSYCTYTILIFNEDMSKIYPRLVPCDYLVFCDLFSECLRSCTRFGRFSLSDCRNFLGELSWKGRALALIKGSSVTPLRLNKRSAYTVGYLARGLREKKIRGAWRFARNTIARVVQVGQRWGAYTVCRQGQVAPCVRCLSHTVHVYIW